jgi:hypothetical protein
VKAALFDASQFGKINLPFSRHGENRIPNVEKYMVSDGDRLVVQVIDAQKKIRAFLFVGTHDDTQSWLDEHKDYRWVARKSDSKVEFVQVTASMAQQPTQPNDTSQPPAEASKPILERAVEEIVGPLLGFLETEGWGGLALRNETKDFLKTVDQHFMFTREEEVLERLPMLEPEKRANLLYDLLCLAAKGNFEELKHRLALHKDEAQIVEGEKLAAAIQQMTQTH